MASELPAKPIRSLQLLCQLEVVKTLYAKATSLERDYFDDFCGNLQHSHQKLEQEIDVRPNDVDPAEIVADFERKKAEKEAEEAQKRLKAAGRNIKIVSAANNSPKRLRSATRKSKKPYEPMVETTAVWSATSLSENIVVEVERKVPSLASRFAISKDLGKIPKGFNPADYIRYKKCKFIQDIEAVRQYLQSRLNCRILTNLMSTLENIMFASGSRGGCSRECILTVQMILTNSNTTFVNFKPLKLWNNLAFRKMTGSILSANFLYDNEPNCMETRTETAIMHHALKSAVNLTHIQMAGAACDSFLKVISEVCLNLQYLDISDSFVSNKGLYYLAGVTEEESRSSRYSRRCKKSNESQTKSTLVKTKRGCSQLTYLLANNLKKISWPAVEPKKYMGLMASFITLNTVMCPKDSGFLMVLKYLPKLRLLLNEKGGKIIETLMAERLRLKVSKLPNLQVISDLQMTKAAMKAIVTMCPNIKSIIMKSYDGGSDETWLEVLNKSSHQIESLHVLEATFKGPGLCNHLLTPITGARLSFLDIREMCYFRMSWLQRIKKNCQNLQKLVIGINTKNIHISTHIQMIDIIKDFNLENGEGKDDPLLTQLEVFHLVGPFGPEVTSYMMKGASRIKDLGLGIDWMDSHYCSVQPISEKDFIGIEYLKEIIQVNPLLNLYQLHLSGLPERSRSKLDKDCLNFVLTMFGATLKHLGNFFNWNLSSGARRDIAEGMTDENRAIVLEEHLKYIRSEYVSLHEKYVEDRQSFSCQDPNSLVFQQYNSMRIVYDVGGNIADITDTNDDLSNSDPSELSFDFDGSDNELDDNGNLLNLWQGIQDIFYQGGD